MKYLLTQDSLTVTVQGKPYCVSSLHKGFPAIRDAVLRGEDPVKVLGLIQHEATRVKNMVAETLRRQQLTGSLTYEDGVIFYNGTPLHNYAVDTLIKFLNMGHDITALANFIDKMMKNPNPMVHDELYKFLEFGKIPLTPDGDFLVYKAVRGDYRDIHSGTFDNSIGKSPRLAGGYQAVDPDRNRTCSYGLHVCSFGYLPHFAHDNGHVMLCKVNPADVVAIPADYNNTKMRVVGYTVVDEVTSYYRANRDFLSENRLVSGRFEVHYEQGDGAKDLYDEFFTLEEACAQARDIKGDGSAWVVDTQKGDEVVYTA